jgi:hypothetical protein
VIPFEFERIAKYSVGVAGSKELPELLIKLKLVLGETQMSSAKVLASFLTRANSVCSVFGSSKYGFQAHSPTRLSASAACVPIHTNALAPVAFLRTTYWQNYAAAQKGAIIIAGTGAATEVQYIASIDAGLEKPELICTIGHPSEEGFVLGGADVSR